MTTDTKRLCVRCNKRWALKQSNPPLCRSCAVKVALNVATVPETTGRRGR